MSEELKVHAAAEAFYCGKPLAVVHDPVNGPLVKACAILDAFKAGAAWQMGRVVADVAGDRDVKEQLQPNEGGYRLRLNGDGPHELHHFGNPEALKALREVFANGTTLDSKDAAAIPRRVPRMPTPHDELMAKLEEIGGDLVHSREDMARMFGNVLKTLDNNVSDQSGRHKAITGALVELIQKLPPPPSDGVPLTEIMAALIDVGQKVEAVLDQVTPRDNGPYNATEPAEHVLRETLKNMGIEPDQVLRVKELGDVIPTKSPTSTMAGVSAAYREKCALDDMRDQRDRAERLFRFWKMIARMRLDQIGNMGDLIDDLTNPPDAAKG